MLAGIKTALVQELGRVIQEAFAVADPPVIEVPPRRELGDLACPSALHLARALKRRPRELATEIAAALRLPEGVERVAIEGAGYLNFFLDRSRFAADLLGALAAPAGPAGSPDRDAAAVPLKVPKVAKVIVEHTNINPNKAAHIGHLRNAVLGDVLARSFRILGRDTEVQNYIDDTGVQLADVVVGFLDMRGEQPYDIAAHPEPFDYLCWDVYSEVGRWYEADPERQKLRRTTLHALESGEGERADVGRLIADRIVRRHLKTMARLGIGYDLLTHESEILRLDFFARAFAELKAHGAVVLESEGKNAGCWVMPLRDSDEFRGLEDPDKVIVRSDGTVTYVGKDIAYQLWKFGLLGLDFEYRRTEIPNLWETAPIALGEPIAQGEQHPAFGAGELVINVIDARQSYLQRVVRAGLESLGHEDAAASSRHFAYEMVSLSPRTARQLGFLDDQADDRTLEMSGRKGIGVKADDLLDQLEAKARAEISQRNRELEDAELAVLSRQIACAALRYFMVKATTTRVIAFDLDEALSFEGDSGPYLQYSLVRAANIRRRLVAEGIAGHVEPAVLAATDPARWADDLWDLTLSCATLETVVERATETLELSLLARLATDLAQKFHAVYHRHPILREDDLALRNLRLGVVSIFRYTLERLSHLLGMPIPERM